MKENAAKLIRIKVITPPSSEEIREFMGIFDLNQEEVAILTGISIASVKKWCLSSGTKEQRKIPYAAWRLLLIYSGMKVSTDSINEILKHNDNLFD